MGGKYRMKCGLSSMPIEYIFLLCQGNGELQFNSDFHISKLTLFNNDNYFKQQFVTI